MGYIANIFSFKYLNLLLTVVLSLFLLSACNNNKDKGDNRHTEKQEISPLGEGQSVNDLYPTAKAEDEDKDKVQTNIKQISQDKLINDYNIILNLDGNFNSSSVCQVLILKVNSTVDTQAAPYMPTYAQEFNDSIEEAYAKLSKGSSFLNSTVVYTNTNETLYSDKESNTFYVSINKTNLTTLSDISNNSYYPLVICGEDSYSDFAHTNKLNFTDNTTTQEINVPVKPFAQIRLLQPHRSAIERAEPQPDVNKILLDIVFATEAKQACKLAILQTPKNYPANNYITHLYTTVYSQISKYIATGSSFLGGTVVYSNPNEKIYIDGSTLQKYFELDKQNFTNFDLSTNDYYPIVTCGDELYSDFSSSANLVANQTTGVVNNVDVVLSNPTRPTRLQTDEPKISSNMFIINITFTDSNTFTNSACQLIIASIDPSIIEPRKELAAGVFMKTAQALRGLQAGTQLTNNSTVVYSNSNETLYQSEATGQVYISVTPTTASSLDLHTKDYYPIVFCDTIYSDIQNETKFVSTDGLNIDVHEVKMIRPQVIAYTASEDPAFGASAPSSTSATDAFNANRSFTFVLNLTKIPDPQNANCLYAASIVYGANASNATLPMNLTDFESLVPGGSFGNSEDGGVLLVVRNPAIHSAANGDYYLGVTSRIAKNVTNYTNVALCQLSSGAFMAGHNVNNSMTASTFNTDSAQGVFFNAIELQTGANLPITRPEKVFNNSADPKFYAQIKFETDIPRRNCQSGDGLVMFFPMTDAEWNNLKSIYANLGYAWYTSAFPPSASGAQGTNNGHDYVAYDLQLSSDYLNWYTNSGGIAPALMTRSVATATAGHGFVTTGTNKKAYIIGFCRDGSTGAEFVSNISQVQPMQVELNNGIYEITPRPYVMHLKRSN